MKRRIKKRYNKSMSNGERFLVDKFIEWIKNQHCCVSARSAPSDPAHVKSWQSSRKHWYNVVPLNHSIHRRLHNIGILTFEDMFNVDLTALAIKYTNLFVKQSGCRSLEDLIEAYKEERV